MKFKGAIPLAPDRVFQGERSKSFVCVNYFSHFLPEFVVFVGGDPATLK